MTKSEGMTNDEIQKTGMQFRAFTELFAPDLAEDQVGFFGFLPEDAGLGFHAGFCGGHHAQEELGFASLFTAGADLVLEILSRDAVVRFAVVRPHAGSSSNQLLNQPIINRT